MLTIRPTYTHKFNISPNLKFFFFFRTASWTAFCHSVLTRSLLLCVPDLASDALATCPWTRTWVVFFLVFLVLFSPIWVWNPRLLSTHIVEIKGGQAMQYMDLRDLTVIGRPSAIRKSFPRHHGVHYFSFSGTRQLVCRNQLKAGFFQSASDLTKGRACPDADLGVL
jgi:hypothetical protein